MTIDAHGVETFGITFALLGLFVAYFAVDDAQDDGWYRAVGPRSVLYLVVWDLVVTWAALAVLLSVSTGVWHGLAAANVVTPRTQTGFGTLILCVVAALFSAVPVLSTRVSKEQRKAVLNGFTKRRDHRLRDIRQSVKLHQSTYHNDVVLPALLRWEVDPLCEHVHSFLEAQEEKRVEASRAARIRKYVKTRDRTYLLTFAAEIVKVPGGRKYLDELVGRAPRESPSENAPGATGPTTRVWSVDDAPPRSTDQAS